MLGTLILMGTVSFGASMIESLMQKSGKVKEANMVSFTANALMVGTCVTSALKAFAELKKLGA